MLYICNEVKYLGDDFHKRMMPLLSEERVAKVKRLRYKNGKNESANAYMLLRIALRENYGIDDAVEFGYHEKGKPFLKDFPGIHFNLSHSKGVAACVVSDSEVGVDVQTIRSVTDRTAKRVLTEAEYAVFKGVPKPDEYFCGIWAIKESYMKRNGQGIAAAFRKLPADEITDRKLIREKDYYCSVCGSFLERMKVKYIRREDFELLLN